MYIRATQVCEMEPLRQPETYTYTKLKPLGSWKNLEMAKATSCTPMNLLCNPLVCRFLPKDGISTYVAGLSSRSLDADQASQKL